MGKGYKLKIAYESPRLKTLLVDTINKKLLDDSSKDIRFFDLEKLEQNYLLYLYLLFNLTDFNVRYRAPYQVGENPKDGTLLSLDIRLFNNQEGKNFYDHINSWVRFHYPSFRLESKFVLEYYQGGKLNPAAIIGIPMIHSGTLNYLDRVSKASVNHLFEEKLKKFFRVVPYGECSMNTLIFGSMSLSLYGMYSKSDSRPANLNFWKNCEKIQDRDGFNSYRINDNDGESDKVSLTERAFGFFSMMANASPGVKYIPSTYDFLPAVKIQVDNEDAGLSLYNILTMDDLFYAANNSVFAYGTNFLTLDLEVFRKHLKYLENCKNSGRSYICDGAEINRKDIADFIKLQEYIIQGRIQVPDNFTKEQYISYLGLNEPTIPIHSYIIYSSIDNAYGKEAGLNIIHHPDKDAKEILQQFTKVGFSIKIPHEEFLYYKTVRRAETKNDQEDIYLDIFTASNDALKGLLFTHQKIYRNVSLSSLPKTPIKYGNRNLPSLWLWILNDRGSLDVILVTNGLELIAKHIALAYQAGKIVAAGELRVQTNGDIVVNINSRDYGKKSEFIVLDNPIRYTNTVMDYFGLNIRFGNPSWPHKLLVTDYDLITTGTLPYPEEWKLLCSGFKLANRVHISDSQIPGYYEDIENTTLSLCNQPNITQKIKSIDVDLDDFIGITTQFDFDEIKLNGDLNIIKVTSVYSTNTRNILNSPSVSRFLNDASNYSYIKQLPPSEERSVSLSLVILTKMSLINLGIPETKRSKLTDYFSFKITYYDEPGAQYEIDTYRLIYERLIKTRITINIPVVIYSDKANKNNPLLMKWFNDALPLKKRKAGKSINTLILEWNMGTQMAKMKSNIIERISRVSIISIIHQVLWTINALNYNGIRHHDMHLGNIFVSYLPKAIPLVYLVPDQKQNMRQIKIKTNFLVKIFDFDMAHYDNRSNERLNGLDNLLKGVNDTKMDYRIDVNRFLCQISWHNWKLHPAIQEILTAIYGQDHRQKLSLLRGGSCFERTNNPELPDITEAYTNFVQKVMLKDTDIKVGYISELNPEDLPNTPEDMEFFTGKTGPVGTGTLIRWPIISERQRNQIKEDLLNTIEKF